MNILQVVPELSAGGVERTAIEISQALSAAGHGSHVASLGGRLEGELTQAGGALHRLDMKTKNPLKWSANTKALIQIIKNNNIDIVHARSRAPARSAHAAAKACGVSFVTTYHGIYNAGNGLKRRYNAIMARGDSVIANSQFTADHIIAEHGTREDKIIVIARGVDMARFDPSVISRKAVANLREAWGVGPAQKCLLLPGRLTAWKGQLVTVSAMAEICKKHDAMLVLLGDPQGRDSFVARIQELAASLGLSDTIKIPGHSDDMPTALMAADIVISASTDPEAFGRIAAEAQAMERWIIASDHGGARETVIDGVTGTRVTPGNARALSDAVIAALSPLPDLGRSRAHIEANFSDSQMKAATLAVYQQLMADKLST